MKANKYKKVFLSSRPFTYRGSYGPLSYVSSYLNSTVGHPYNRQGSGKYGHLFSQMNQEKPSTGLIGK